MGNDLSCMSVRVHCPAIIKVLHAGNGHIFEFHGSMKAVELLLENPNYFVIHSSCIHSGQRISPLSADEELKAAHVYILLPMQKLHSRLSFEEAAALATVLSKLAAGNSSKHAHSNKVTPVGADPQGMDVETVGITKSGEWAESLLQIHSFQQVGSIAGLSMEMGSQGATRRPELEIDGGIIGSK